MKIIRDTREKQGWQFDFYDKVTGIESTKINCGDYTTELLHNKIVIERKATASEIANNLGKRYNRARFYREFTRMETLKRAYIVCEFSEQDVYEFPNNASMSQEQISKVRINGKYLRKLIGDIERDHPNIEVVFCGDRETAEKFTYDILTFWEKEYEKK